MTPTELWAACERAQLRAEVKHRLLEGLDVPVLHVDAEDDVGASLRRCHAFIEEHSHGR